MASGIRFGHSNAAVPDGGLQRIFDGGGIGSQRSSQLVVEHIAGKVVDAALGLVHVCGGQADSRQHGVGALRAIEAIQHTHLTLPVHQLIVHGDVGHAKVGELDASDSVLCQFVNNGIVMQASADIGLSIPHAVVAGFGDVVFVDAQGRLSAGVNGRLGKCCGDKAEGHERRYQQRQYAMGLFHVQLFSLSII